VQNPLVIRPANRTPLVLASILAIGPPVLASIPAVIAQVLAPLHPGRLCTGI
jgi:hypothetical protein